MKFRGSSVANNKGWQKRTDEWVKMSHESRKRKEAEQQERRRRGPRSSGDSAEH
ncbi:hypothetical protein ACXYTJ_05285 [Gilvimarinus sp. F26214L]|uniref:hypothetical protein n=1 Tax=Gilvimarinus sp. DZF01 TaxID=3461371 RepID=UPI0040467614